MTRPTAIYRPIERDVLLTDGANSLAVSRDFARASAKSLVISHGKGTCHHTLMTRLGFFSVGRDDMLHLACEIDHALAVPTIAAAMLDDAQWR